MNTLKICFLFFLLAFLPACNHYDQIPGATTRRVVYARNHEIIGREEGGKIVDKVFGAGQWDHQTAGPAVAYDFDIAQEQFASEGSMTMADKVVMKHKWVWQFNLKDDHQALKDGLFNFPVMDAIDFHTGNDLKVYKISSDEIFKRYALPFADMAFRDVLGKNASSDAVQSVNEIAEKGYQEALKVLGAIKYPRFTVNAEGLVDFNPKDSVSILDLITLSNVTYNEYEMPKDIQDKISAVESTRSDYQALLKDKELIDIRAKTKIEKAAAMQKKNLVMTQMLQENPQVLSFAASQKLNELLTSGKVKAKVIIIPGGTNIHINQ